MEGSPSWSALSLHLDPLLDPVIVFAAQRRLDEGDDLHGDRQVERRPTRLEEGHDLLEQLAVDVPRADGDVSDTLLREGQKAVIGLALADAAHASDPAVFP